MEREGERQRVREKCAKCSGDVCAVEMSEELKLNPDFIGDEFIFLRF